MKLTDAEHEDLTQRAAAVGMTVPRLLVETTLEREDTEAGQVAVLREALLAFADLDSELRRVGNNLNQLTRYSHQDKEFAEGVEFALGAVVRVCLHLDEAARSLVGKAPGRCPTSANPCSTRASGTPMTAVVGGPTRLNGVVVAR